VLDNVSLRAAVVLLASCLRVPVVSTHRVRAA
jgi:hypothetical protein